MKPPEDVRREFVQTWMAKADDDFALIDHLLLQQGAFLNAIGFHAQQAVEKYLKAYLVSSQVEFPKTHDLERLLDLVSTIDTAFADSLREATLLSVYGVDIRYPGDLPDMTVDTAREAVRLASHVRQAVKKFLELPH